MSLIRNRWLAKFTPMLLSQPVAICRLSYQYGSFHKTTQQNSTGREACASIAVLNKPQLSSSKVGAITKSFDARDIAIRGKPPHHIFIADG